MGCSFDEKWMRLALEQAKLARDMGEIPVGAVIVRDGEVVSVAHNLCETEHQATAHAEMLAIDRACRALGTNRLSGCTLYVTLEPCPMCAGALIHARLDRVVFAAKDPRAGAFGSLINLYAYPLESHPVCESGPLSEESLVLLRDFFEKLRQKAK